MRARNVWIIAGIAAMGAIAAWYFLRSGSGRSTPDRGATASSSGTTGSAGSGSTTREPTRSIPPTRVTPPPGAPDDDAWARDTTAMLGPRLDGVLEGSGVKVTAIECAASTCAITVEAPDDAALGAAISRLEAPEGLSGVAAQMLLHAPEDVPGGRRAVVDAQFDR